MTKQKTTQKKLKENLERQELTLLQLDVLEYLKIQRIEACTESFEEFCFTYLPHYSIIFIKLPTFSFFDILFKYKKPALMTPEYI